jgi:hypothetical protein
MNTMILQSFENLKTEVQELKTLQQEFFFIWENHNGSKTEILY